MTPAFHRLWRQHIQRALDRLIPAEPDESPAVEVAAWIPDVPSILDETPPLEPEPTPVMSPHDCGALDACREIVAANNLILEAADWRVFADQLADRR